MTDNARSAIPERINYQGYLTNASGSPINANVSMTFRIYTVASGGTALWTETQSNVPVNEGIYNVILGSVASLGALPFDVPYFLGVTAGADSEMTPRQALTSVAYALTADTALGLICTNCVSQTDIDQTSIQRRVSGTCGAGSSIRVINQDGTVSCEPDDTGGTPSGTVTTLDGTSASGTAGEYSRGDHKHGIGTGAITTGHIQDGAIMNADINASAAIAGSKLASDGSVMKSLSPGTNISVTNNNNGSWTVTSTGGSSGWSLTGNAVTTPGTNFIGTTDNKALEVKVNNTRALRIEPTGYSPNIIGGISDNFITAGVSAATICGGGDIMGYVNRVTDFSGTIGGGVFNQAGNNAGTTGDASYATVSGGFGNTASGKAATVGGGLQNFANAKFATIGGGGPANEADPDSSRNRVTDDYGTIGGGGNNQAGNNAGTTTDATYATVSGGVDNDASATSATVGGGGENIASGSHATVSGGGENTASGSHATVGGGGGNTVIGNYAIVGGGNGNQASEVYAAVGGGQSNTASGSNATVGGGYSNGALVYYATVGGGQSNTANGYTATVSGGGGNFASGENATVGGGILNRANAKDTAIGGGNGTEASGVAATVSGGEGNTVIGNYAIVGGGNGNQASADAATVGGGNGNQATGWYAMVGGGSSNQANQWASTVGGGAGNAANEWYATIGGGQSNTASANSATIGGGQSNTASADSATVGGGNGNHAENEDAVVGGGIQNFASGPRSAVGGGYQNQATNNAATVPGGANNLASGGYSFAAGAAASAIHTGSFVWSSAEGTSSFGNNTFTVRAHGGVAFYTSPGTGTGCIIASGGSDCAGGSDRNIKENYADVDSKEILETLMTLPIQTWNYKSQSPTIRHIGPVAQDLNSMFAYLFNEVESPVHVNKMDEIGISFAAIQGLYHILKEKDTKIKEQDARIEKLEKVIAEMERRLAFIEAPTKTLVMR